MAFEIQIFYVLTDFYLYHLKPPFYYISVGVEWVTFTWCTLLEMTQVQANDFMSDPVNIVYFSPLHRVLEVKKMLNPI